MARWNAAPSLRAPGPTAALQSLLPSDPPRAAAAPGTLAKLRPLHVEPPDRRLSPLDVSWRVCPADLVAGLLPYEQRFAWQDASEAREALRNAYKLRMALQRASSECAASQCPDAACLHDWLQAQENEVLPALEERHTLARNAAIAELEHALKRNPNTSLPHVSFALAALIEDTAWQSDDEPAHEVLDRIVALLRTASEGSDVTTPFGWFARYELGRALSQRGNPDEAIAAWATIEQSKPPESVSAIEVAWRIADAATTDVAPAWERVALRCPLPPTSADVLCPAADYKWMASAYERGSWRKAIHAASRLLVYAEQVDGGVDAREEAYSVIATSLDALGGEGTDELPSIPEQDARFVAEGLNAKMLARASAGSLEAELAARVSALVASCLDEGSEGMTSPMLLRVSIERGGTIRVRATPASKTVRPDAAQGCLQRRGAWFFRDARSGAEVSVRRGKAY